MTLQQLEKLSQNPNYKLSKKQIEMLNEYRETKFKNYKANGVFQKHAVELDKEQNG